MNLNTTTSLQPQLEAYLAAQPATGSNPRVESLRLMDAEWSSADYAFTLIFDEPGGTVTQHLILKTFPNTPEGIDRTLKERHALYHLRTARYPVPAVMAFEIDPAPLGVPFLIKEYAEAEPLVNVLETADERRRRGLIAEFVGLFVDLHRRGPDILVKNIPAGSPFVLVNREIHTLRGLADKRQQREFEPVIEWLHAHRKSVPCETPVITNRSFTPSDVLIRPNGMMQIHNWGWQIGDARFDLAWTLLDLQRGGLADLRDMVLAEYERVTGAPVAELAYFEVLAAVRWLMDTGYEGRLRGDSAPGSDPFKETMLAEMRQAIGQIAARTGIELPDAEVLIS